MSIFSSIIAEIICVTLFAIPIVAIILNFKIMIKEINRLEGENALQNKRK